MNENKLKVGLGTRDYGYRRLTYGLPVSDAEYKKVLYIPWKLLNKNNPQLKNTYYFNPFSSIDIYHMWNSVCLNKKPWIISVESHMPRHPEHRKGFLHKLALDKLHSDYCRKILPFSKFSKQFILWQNRDNIDETLIDKMEVFYGGIPISDEAINEHTEFLKNKDETFKVIFVGHDFFRKGGVPLLRAFKSLRDELKELKLVVISRVANDSYVTSVDSNEIEETKRKLSEDDRIEWHESLPFENVLDKMTTSHVGTLATLDDQFPWSPVETMSRGVPVIASNVTSLTEQVIHKQNGFTVNVPRYENLRWKGMMYPQDSEERKKELTKANDKLTEGMSKYIKELYYDREKLRKMSSAAVQHVREQHNPATQAKKIKRIYDQALE